MSCHVTFSKEYGLVIGRATFVATKRVSVSSGSRRKKRSIDGGKRRFLVFRKH